MHIPSRPYMAITSRLLLAVEQLAVESSRSAGRPITAIDERNTLAAMAIQICRYRPTVSTYTTRPVLTFS